MDLLNYNGAGVPGDTNGVFQSTNIVSSGGTLLTNLLSAAGAIGIAKLANAEGQTVVATGNPLNPVQVVTPGQTFSNQLAQNSGLIIVGLGLVAVLVAFSARRR